MTSVGHCPNLSGVSLILDQSLQLERLTPRTSLCRHQDRLPLVSRGEDTRLLFKLWLPVLCRVSAQKVHGVHGQCVDSYQLDELPRLTLWVVLCEYEGSLNVMGPNCNSWTLPARGTTIRNYVNIHGAMHLRFVEEGNRCISRCLSPNKQLT